MKFCRSTHNYYEKILSYTYLKTSPDSIFAGFAGSLPPDQYILGFKPATPAHKLLLYLLQGFNKSDLGL